MNIANYTPENLRRAADLADQIGKQQAIVDTQTSALNALKAEMQTLFPAPVAPVRVAGTRNFTDESRRKISEAQKARHAAAKAKLASLQAAAGATVAAPVAETPVAPSAEVPAAPVA
jgi:hypothetical protein